MEFKLRPWRIEDLNSLVHYANNKNIAAFLTDQFAHPYTEENGRKFISFANSDEPVHIFAIDVDGEAVGGIGIHPQQDIMRMNAELGYWLGEPFWGKGIITNAVKQMLPFAFENYPINRVFARPFSNNPASRRVLEKCGFKLEAILEKTIYKNDEYLDEFIFGYRREMYNNN